MLRLTVSRIPISDTSLASTMVRDYLGHKPEVMKWISVPPSLQEIRSFRSRRAKHPVDRKILHQALTEQYACLEQRNETVHASVRSNIEALLQLPFHEYMARRTKFAVDRAQRDNLIDIDHYFLSLLQATWARDYWINKAQGTNQ